MRKTTLSVLLILLAACGGERPLAPSNQTPVIVISIDTLRSDRLPAYGYKGVETPHLDALRSDSILYQSAWSHCPLTLPSHGTMLTGMYPADNGLRDNIGYSMNKDVATIGEVLKKNGYQTGAAVSTFVLRSESGISRGFDFYDDDFEVNLDESNLGRVQRDGHETEKIAEQWLTRHRENPFFFLLHLYEPHTPYEPPEPFRSRYAASPYDGEIAAADAIVGNFLDFLKKEGLYDKSLILLLSDHGEGLGDHGEDEHGIFLYREAIQVPLMVKLPKSKFAGRSVATAVQLADVFPTIAEQTGSKFDAAKIHGASLLSVMEDNPERPIFSESYFARIHFGWSDMHSMVQNNLHYIHAPQPELYDLAADAAEKKNVLAENRRAYVSLRKATEALVVEPSARQNIAPEEAEKLAALGYLGSSTTPTTGLRPDPKEKIGTLRDIKLALGFFRDERDVEAVDRFRKLLREQPGMLDIWDALSRSLIRLQRHQEAAQAAREALKISPTTSHFAILVANAELEAGNLDEAAKHAELVLEKEPAQAHDVLARIALERQQYDEAKRHAETALQTRRDRVSSLLTLARIENERNNPRAALEYCDRLAAIMAEKKMEKMRRLHFNRGDAFGRLGNYREAEVELRKEIQDFPRDPQAYKNLILLYVTLERLDDATKVIYELERAAPTPPAYAAISETLKVVGDPQGSRLWARRGLQKFPQDPTLKKLARG